MIDRQGDDAFVDVEVVGNLTRRSIAVQQAPDPRRGIVEAVSPFPLLVVDHHLVIDLMNEEVATAGWRSATVIRTAPGGHPTSTVASATVGERSIDSRISCAFSQNRWVLAISASAKTSSFVR